MVALGDSIMNKPLKGVITNWSLIDGRIYGKCAFHTTCDNGILPGEPITTSSVVNIYTRHGARFAETLNSLYVLV